MMKEAWKVGKRESRIKKTHNKWGENKKGESGEI